MTKTQMTKIPPLELFLKGYKGLIYAFDPGETTGFASFMDGELVEAKQLQTHTVAGSAPMLLDLLTNTKINSVQEVTGYPFEVVIEDYLVYEWKSDSHSWNNMHTSRLIGCIEGFCAVQGIPLTKRMAQHAKTFVTDEKLKAWGLYDGIGRHARDAVRHAIFQMIFGSKDASLDPTVNDQKK